MVDDNQESLEVNQPTETNAQHEEQQSLLLKLAERTVLQAEALAQEIAEHARQESETAGARLLAQYATSIDTTPARTFGPYKTDESPLNK